MSSIYQTYNSLYEAIIAHESGELVLYLYLDFHDLEEIPEEIQDFNYIVKLTVVNNNISYLPSFLLDLHYLEELDISSNPFIEDESFYMIVNALESKGVRVYYGN